MPLRFALSSGLLSTGGSLPRCHPLTHADDRVVAPIGDVEIRAVIQGRVARPFDAIKVPPNWCRSTGKFNEGELMRLTDFRPKTWFGSRYNLVIGATRCNPVPTRPGRGVRRARSHSASVNSRRRPRRPRRQVYPSDRPSRRPAGISAVGAARHGPAALSAVGGHCLGIDKGSHERYPRLFSPVNVCF